MTNFIASLSWYITYNTPALNNNLNARYLELLLKSCYTFFSPSIGTSGKNIFCNDKKIKKSNFMKSKKPSKIDEVDVDKILVSKRKSHGRKR